MQNRLQCRKRVAVTLLGAWLSGCAEIEQTLHPAVRIGHLKQMGTEAVGRAPGQAPQSRFISFGSDEARGSLSESGSDDGSEKASDKGEGEPGPAADTDGQEG